MLRVCMYIHILQAGAVVNREMVAGLKGWLGARGQVSKRVRARAVDLSLKLAEFVLSYGMIHIARRQLMVPFLLSGLQVSNILK